MNVCRLKGPSAFRWSIFPFTLFIVSHKIQTYVMHKPCASRHNIASMFAGKYSRPEHRSQNPKQKRNGTRRAKKIIFGKNRKFKLRKRLFFEIIFRPNYCMRKLGCVRCYCRPESTCTPCIIRLYKSRRFTSGKMVVLFLLPVPDNNASSPDCRTANEFPKSHFAF